MENDKNIQKIKELENNNKQLLKENEAKQKRKRN